METERLSPRYSGIDVWDPSDILDAMVEGQFAAVAAVRAARQGLEAAALAIEPRLRDGDRLLFAAVGGGLSWGATVLEWNFVPARNKASDNGRVIAGRANVAAGL